MLSDIVRQLEEYCLCSTLLVPVAHNGNYAILGADLAWSPGPGFPIDAY